MGVGLATGTLLKPGVGVGQLQLAEPYTPREVPGPIQVLLDVVPTNPFAALAGGKILQVIFFAGLLGFALVNLQPRRHPRGPGEGRGRGGVTHGLAG